MRNDLEITAVPEASKVWLNSVYTGCVARFAPYSYEIYYSKDGLATVDTSPTDPTRPKYDAEDFIEFCQKIYKYHDFIIPPITTIKLPFMYGISFYSSNDNTECMSYLGFTYDSKKFGVDLISFFEQDDQDINLSMFLAKAFNNVHVYGGAMEYRSESLFTTLPQQWHTDSIDLTEELIFGGEKISINELILKNHIREK